VTYSSNDPTNMYYSSSWFDWVASSTGRAVMLDCFCDRLSGDDVVLTVVGVRGWNGEPAFSDSDTVSANVAKND